MTFVTLILRPALSRHAEEAAMKPVASFIRARFRWVAVLLTAIIVASGVVQIIVEPPAGWNIALLIAAVLLGAAVLVFYFRNAFAKVAIAGPVEPPPSPPSDGPLPTTAPKDAGEWKTAWLLKPSDLQVKLEFALIAGAVLFLLLNVILVR
jgi:hypothetical protein